MVNTPQICHHYHTHNAKILVNYSWPLKVISFKLVQFLSFTIKKKDLLCLSHISKHTRMELCLSHMNQRTGWSCIVTTQIMSAVSSLSDHCSTVQEVSLRLRAEKQNIHPQGSEWTRKLGNRNRMGLSGLWENAS